MRGEESGKGRSGSALSGQHVPYQLPRRRVPTRMGRFRPAAGNRERQSGDGEALSAAQTSAPNALPAGVHKAGRTRKGGARLLRGLEGSQGASSTAGLGREGRGLGGRDLARFFRPRPNGAL